MADEQRIAVLEQHVRGLYEQIGALRQELREYRGTASAPPAPEVVPPPAAPRVAETPPPRPTAEAPRAFSEPPPPPPPPPRPRPRRDPNLHQQSPDIDLEKLFGRY